MAIDAGERVQRGLNFAIVDEVDNILIDEARTPLIISGPAADPVQLYSDFAKLAPRLQQEEDYTIDDRTRAISLTQEGISKMERWTKVGNLYDPDNFHLVHYIENALNAHVMKVRDKDYVVREGEVVIVDEFTGRLQFGRRWSDGLHQAVEAKEGLKVQRESVTYATITLQNYFRMYNKLAGMTGTAETEADEFLKIYNLDVTVIPTNVPMVREEAPDLVFQTEESKWRNVAEEIASLHEKGQPVLVGTTSIEASEALSDRLKKRGVPHQVLNAKNHEHEAGIISQAGRLGAVTVSTNMAGRGTDIVLGGSDTDRSDWVAEHDQVIRMGGLHVWARNTTMPAESTIS
jgi:preprotein translocase subunit SecA